MAKLKLKDLRLKRSFVSLILKELKSILFSSTGLIVGSLFIVVVAILLFGIGRYNQFGTNDLTQMFGYIAFALAIAVPALTMGAISKEKSNGTFEYLLSKPLTELDLLLGKFISYSLLTFILILLTLPITVVVASYSGIDFGQAVMQYAGALVLGLCMVSVGLAISALFKAEIASFLTSVVVIAVLILIGSSFVAVLPAPISSILEKLSLLSHYQSVSRGVLDFRDIFYFIAFIFLFLSLAYYLLIKDKYPVGHKYLKKAKVATALFVIIAFLLGTLGQVIPGRIDFTSDQRYTLSAATVEVLNRMPNSLTVDYYASSNLPIEFQSELRRVQDLLSDYSKASGGKVSVNLIEPDKDTSLQSKAQTDGISQIQFSVNSSDSAQVVVGYFGVAFKYEDKSEVLNFNNEILNDLEYQITKKIKKLSETQKRKIAFITNNVAHSTTNDLTVFNKELVDLFDVTSISLTEESAEIAEDISTVIIAGPVEEFTDNAVTELKNFYVNGGSIFLMTDTIDTNTETPALNENSLAALFEEYGVKINNDMVYDLENNNIIALQSLFSPIVFNFPMWFIANSVENSTNINKDVTNVSLLFASSISTENKDGHTIYTLLETGNSANIQTSDNLNLSFDQDWQPSNTDSKRTVAVALENSNGGRAVVVADTDFLTDSILEGLAQRQSQDKNSISFALNAVSWLAKDSLIGSIKSKGNTATLLNLDNTKQVTLVAVGTMVPITLSLAPYLFAVIQRRKLRNKKYQSEAKE